ncbi:MAG: Arm DNA-binding domain-containing protein, partial [Spirosomaceae bacterium]|nr:Arm DNA-binding domain-containing protein [Spirosomataceae bacterium]
MTNVASNRRRTLPLFLSELPATAYRVDGKRADISIKSSIVPHLWNSDKGLVKGQSNDARSINHQIEQIRS